MTQMKVDQKEHQESQQKHLEEMNERLQQYLEAAHKQQFIDHANAIATGQAPVAVPQTAPAATTMFGQLQSPQQFEQAVAQAFNVPSSQQGWANDQSQPQAGHVTQFISAVPHYSQQALRYAGQVVMTPQQVGLAAARRVVPVVSAYSRLPMMSNRRRYGQNRPAAA
jgi:hypothetical protein